MKLIIGGSFQGKYQWALSQYDKKNIWNNFHCFVKEEIQRGKNQEQIQNEILKRINDNPDLVIISNELGCGVVPFNEEDRNYREITGRLLCLIAEKAESLIRITCGVPQKIK